jgi:hypothetical protein
MGRSLPRYFAGWIHSVLNQKQPLPGLDGDGIAIKVDDVRSPAPMAAQVHSLKDAWNARAQALRAELARLEVEQVEIEARIELLHREIEGARAAASQMSFSTERYDTVA